MSSSRRPATRKYKMVIIHWGDAFIETDDFTYEDALTTTPVYRKSIGFLIAKNQHGYVLATDTYDSSPEVAAKMFIPKGMVKEVTYLSPR